MRTRRTFVLQPVPPFRLDLTAWVLRRRARNQIDRWDGMSYRRLIRVNGTPTEIAVRQVGPATEPRLVVTADPPPVTPEDRRQIRNLLERTLGLRVDLRGWYRVAARDDRLRLLAARFRGVKPPRFPTLFEALVNAFACQQLSLDVGLELLNRLAVTAGATRHAGTHVEYAFPEPRDAVKVPVSRYRAMGFSRQKTRAILELSRGIADDSLQPEELAREQDDVVLERLLAIRGVGRWTAEYVLLRGLGRLDVFPGDDVGAQKRLARWLGRTRPFDYAGVHRAVERWQPYAGMVYFHLLLDGLDERGALGGPA